MADQGNSFAASSAPELQNKAAKAPGILPKNAQTWVIVTIAAVMIAVIAFSNSGTTRPKVKTRTGSNLTVGPPNQRQIDQYRALVDEEARKLALERQRLDQAKLRAQNAAAGAQTQLPGQPYQNPNQPASYTGKEQSPEEVQRLAFEADRRKREYNSLFSSNVALSFRKDQTPAQSTARSSDQQEIPGLTARVGATGNPSITPTPNGRTESGGHDTGEPGEPQIEKRALSKIDPSLQQAEGPNFRLFEGTIFETVLTNRMEGSFNGPANVMVTTAVYSHDHQHLLIPQGSRILGETQRVNSLGQQRLAVMFHRLIMPDGYSLSLDQFKGLNQIGETGLRDQVNHHYLQVFGISLAIGAIGGVTQAGANYGANTGGLDLYREGVSASLSQSALRILDRYLNILPTFVIREGHRVKVYLSDDLMLPAYDRHRIPGNL